MLPVILTPEPLTREGFALYGDVIDTEGVSSRTINSGYTDRFHDLARVDIGDLGGRTAVSIFRSRPLPEPIQITFLERHPLGSQAFIPLAATPFLILTALHPERRALRLFRSHGQQGVNYHKGIWHYPLLALGQECGFLVIDREGEGKNCEVAQIDTPVLVTAVGA